MAHSSESFVPSDLEAARSGDAGARTRFWSRGYSELRQVAAAALAQWNGRIGLTPTDVLHEAFVRLAGRDRVTDEGTRFFYASFATECRRLLVDHHRQRIADKRGGRMQRVSLNSGILGDSNKPFDLIDLNDAIEVLAKLDPRAAQIVDLRVFGGMSMDECAAALGVSKRTAEYDWTNARSWLRDRLDG